MNADHAFAGYVSLDGGTCGIKGRLAANKANDAACGHDTGSAHFDLLAGGGVCPGDCGEELLGFVVMAQFKKISLAHGLSEGDARNARTGAAVVGGQTMRDDAFACNDAADNLSAVVGALVAHHTVIRDAMLVGACEVAVEAAFELTRTEGAIMLARCFARKNIVELSAIGTANGMDVIRSFHTAFELEGAGSRAEELG